MNKKGEGVNISLETLGRVVLSAIVLVALWGLAAKFSALWVSDQAEATVRNFDRLVGTINGMEEDDFYDDFPIFIDEDHAIVGWPYGEDANSGICQYGTIEATTIDFTNPLPKPLTCGAGDGSCLCLCEKTEEHSDLCQDAETIVKCATSIDYGLEYSFTGCREGGDHECDFAILLGTEDQQGIFLDRDDGVIEMSLFDCDNYQELGDVDPDTAVASASGSYSSYGGTPSTSMQQMFQNIDESYGDLIDEAIVGTPFSHSLIMGLIVQESGGDIVAVSRTGCSGIMQFCPGTAYDYGLCDTKSCSGTDDRNDPEKAIPAGVKRLLAGHNYFEEYSAAIELGLASYNGGEGVIGQAVAATGSADPSWSQISAALTWDMVTYFSSQEDKEDKVKEITRYVPGVLANAGAYEKWIASLEEEESGSDGDEATCEHENIVAIGASNTAGESYVSLLQQRCPESTVTNAGESGDSPAAQYERFETDVLDHEPDLVIISPSGNGITTSTYTSSVIAMSEAAKEAGAEVVVLAVSPRKGYCYCSVCDETCSAQWSEEIQAYVDAFNVNLLENNLGISAIDYAIDIYTPLESSEEDVCAYCTSDGGHLTSDGHKVVADAIWETVFLDLTS